MSWNPNSGKHKAMHGGYRKKPPQNQVNALLDMYKENDPKNKPNKQLKLFG